MAYSTFVDIATTGRGGGAFGSWSVSGSSSGGVVGGGAPARVPSIAWSPPPPADGAGALSVRTARVGERGDGDRVLSTESQPDSTGGPFAGATSGGGNRVLSAESQLDSTGGPFVAVADRVLSTESQLGSASGPFCDVPTFSSGGASVAAKAMDLNDLLSPVIFGLLALVANSASVARPESYSGLGEES